MNPRTAGRLVPLLAIPLLTGAVPAPAGEERAGRPLVIAHRGGTADFPENTLLAIEESTAWGADGQWLSVQATKDGVPVLHRPLDLSALTDGTGAVADKTLAELAGLNAGHTFVCADGTYCHRDRPLPIPTLEQALGVIPADRRIYLDLKQLPAGHVVDAVVRTLDRLDAWNRVRLSSTEADTVAMLDAHPAADVSESRDATRLRLAQVALERACRSTPASWAGFELKRAAALTEKFTLGEGRSEITARLWTEESVDCFRSGGPVFLVMYGVNTRADLAEATALTADAVLVDSPRTVIPH